jgi:thioesterase domain-containing protein
VAACVLLDPVGPGRRRRPTKALAYDLVSCTPVRLRPHRVTQQRMAAAERGSRRYRPDAIPVPIVMARAELAGPERWATLTSAGLTVVDVPGDHVSMLHPPHSVVLGERLEPLLQRLQSECPSIPAGSGDR